MCKLWLKSGCIFSNFNMSINPLLYTGCCLSSSNNFQYLIRNLSLSCLFQLFSIYLLHCFQPYCKLARQWFLQFPQNLIVQRGIKNLDWILLKMHIRPIPFYSQFPLVINVKNSVSSSLASTQFPFTSQTSPLADISPKGCISNFLNLSGKI